MLTIIISPFPDQPDQHQRAASEKGRERGRRPTGPEREASENSEAAVGRRDADNREDE